MVRRSPTVLFLAAFAACADEPAPEGWTSSADTLPDGRVDVVHSPPADEWAPTWVLEEELRIGSVDGGGPASFGQIRALAVDPEGRIAVLDRQAQEIRVFSAEGVHLATHGGNGGGPGEFQNALGLMLDAEGRLLVPDQGNARMSVVDPVGGFVASHPLTLHRWSFAWDGVVGDDGRVLVPSVVPGSDRELVRVLDAGMRQVDSLLLPPPPATPEGDPPGAFGWKSPDGSTRGFLQVPFYPQAERLLLPSGEFWSAAAGDPSYRVARWSPAGDTALVVRTGRSQLPVSAAERDSALEGALSAVRQFGVRRLDASRVPSTKPAVLSLFTDDGERLWVATSSPDSLRRYDVYERDGRFAGSVATPLNVANWIRPVVVGDRFHAVVLDEMGVSFVVRARLVEAGDGGE